MIVIIHRNHETIEINAGKDIFVDSAMKREGYNTVNPLDIKNYKDIAWEGNEFNRLFSKQDYLYKFNNWIGDYPYKSFEIEKIGMLKK